MIYFVFIYLFLLLKYAMNNNINRLNSDNKLFKYNLNN